MDELEQRLQSMRLARPSAALDRRMQEAFDAAHVTAAQRQSSRFWWWLVPASGVVCAATILLVALPRLHPTVEPTVYRIEAEGRLRDMLLNTLADHHSTPPSFVAPVDAH